MTIWTWYVVDIAVRVQEHLKKKIVRPLNHRSHLTRLRKEYNIHMQAAISSLNFHRKNVGALVSAQSFLLNSLVFKGFWCLPDVCPLQRFGRFLFFPFCLTQAVIKYLWTTTPKPSAGVTTAFPTGIKLDFFKGGDETLRKMCLCASFSAL